MILDRRVLKTEERLAGQGRFYHKKWYDETYGLGVFKKGIVLDDDLHKERCSRLLI